MLAEVIRGGEDAPAVLGPLECIDRAIPVERREPHRAGGDVLDDEQVDLLAARGILHQRDRGLQEDLVGILLRRLLRPRGLREADRQRVGVEQPLDEGLEDEALVVNFLGGATWQNLAYSIWESIMLISVLVFLAAGAGSLGAGQAELARAIFGLETLSGGRIYLDGQEVKILRENDILAKIL